MSNRSTTTTDKISSPAIETPNGQYSVSLLYKPEHAPIDTGATGNIFAWQNDSASSRIVLVYDNPDSNYRASWFQTASGANKQVTIGTVTAGSWYHFGVRWGYQDSLTSTRAYIESYTKGQYKSSTASGAPTSGAGTSITLWQDNFAANSPLGDLARVGVWSGIALSGGEMAYLGFGGHPLNIRPSTPCALVEFLDLSTDTLDTGPNVYTQTVTGTTNGVANPPNLLPRTLKALERNGNIALVMHQGFPVNDHVIFLAECTDGTGTNFEFRPAYNIPPDGNILRDPDIYYQALTATWWAGCINEGNNGQSYSWDLYKSTGAGKGNEFTYVQSVDCSSITGTGPGANTWKPRFFEDDDGSLHVVVGLSHAGTMSLYEMHPNVVGDLAGSWSIPVQITGSALPATRYDGQVSKIGSTYYMIYTNWLNFPSTPGVLNIEIASSASLTNGYDTPVVSGEDVGWGSVSQGPCLMKRADGRWIAYIDSQDIGMQYSISSDGSLTGTWTTPAPIKFHGLAIGDTNFLPEGASIHRMAIWNPVRRATTNWTPV